MNGETKPIRSIFSSGTVEQTPSGDFNRVYENCPRHIIISNYTYGIEDNVVDTTFIETINNRFKNEAQLHQLITDNLCESVLPYILCNRYKSRIRFITRPDGRDIFSDYMEDVKKVREQYSKDMQKLGTEENIRKTNGNRRKIRELGDRIIARRYKHYLDIKELYYVHRDECKPCEYDKSYTDCKYLAHLHGMKTMTYIGNHDYNNYYLSLLSKIDISSNDNLFNIEYYDVLSKIIKKRMIVEHYSVQNLIAEFNRQFQERINENMDNAYLSILHDLGNEDSKIYHEVQSWISNKLKYKQDEYTQYEIMQLTNMYLFMGTCNITEEHHIPDTEEEMAASIYELTKEENRILCAFWDKCITEYEKYRLTDAIDEVTTLANSHLKYAEWPSTGQINIDGVSYKHYLFANRPKNMKDPYPDDEDEDLGMDYETTEPEIPQDCEVEQAPQEFLLDNEDDP